MKHLISIVALLLTANVLGHEQYELTEELASVTSTQEGQFKFGEPILLTTELFDEYVFDFNSGTMRSESPFGGSGSNDAWESTTSVGSAPDWFVMFSIPSCSHC
jgi:hypothetical protein